MGLQHTEWGFWGSWVPTTKGWCRLDPCLLAWPLRSQKPDGEASQSPRGPPRTKERVLWRTSNWYGIPKTQPQSPTSDPMGSNVPRLLQTLPLERDSTGEVSVERTETGGSRQTCVCDSQTWGGLCVSVPHSTAPRPTPSEAQAPVRQLCSQSDLGQNSPQERRQASVPETWVQPRLCHLPTVCPGTRYCPVPSLSLLTHTTG